MKRSPLRFPGCARRLAVAVSLVFLVPAAPADVLYWDPQGSEAGTGGAGTWDAVSSLWARTPAGIPPFPDPLFKGSVWVDGPNSAATFGGIAGVVAVEGTRSLNEIIFESTGYTLTGGGLRFVDGISRSGGGTIRLAEGVSAKIGSSLDTPASTGTPEGTIRVTGGGTLSLSLPARFEGDIVADRAVLRAGNQDGLRGTALVLEGTARFEAPGLSRVGVGAIRAASRQDLGAASLELDGGGLTSQLSTFSSGLGAQSLRVGASARTSVEIGGAVRPASVSTLSFLDVVLGDVTVANAELAVDPFIAPVEPAVQIGAGSTLTLRDSASLTSSGWIGVSDGGRISVESGSTLRAHRAPAVGGGTIAVGTDGNGAVLSLSGEGSQVFAGQALRIGSVDGASAQVFVGAGTELAAPVLEFHSASLATSEVKLQIANRGTARFRSVDTSQAFGHAGAINMFGGTLILGDETIAPVAGAGTSSFSGLLTGTGGLVRKIGGGTLSLFDQRGLFPGRVQVEDGELIVAPRTLARATLAVSGRGKVSFPYPGAAVAVGALDGTFDLAAPGSAVVLEGDGDGVWKGSFTGGLVRLLKEAGAGVQTLEGTADGTKMKLGGLEVKSAGVRLIRGEFDAKVPSGTSSFSVTGAGHFIDIAEGARVSDLGSAVVNTGALLNVRGSGTRVAGDRLTLTGPDVIAKFADGAASEFTDGITLGSGGELQVDRATLVTGDSLSIHALARVDLSDPEALPGQDVFSAPVAWTIRLRPFVPVSRALQLTGEVNDGSSGAGSVAFTGDDSFVKLDGAAHTGRTIVSGRGAVMEVLRNPASRQLVAMNGGTVQFASVAYSAHEGESFHTDATGTVRWDGMQLSGGTLYGRGHRVDNSAASWQGTVVAEGARVISTAGLLWQNGTLAGTLDAGGGTTELRSLTIQRGGDAILRGESQLSSVRLNGAMQLTTGAMTTLRTPVVLAGGAYLEVARGAQVSGDFIELSDGSLVNHGIVESAVIVGRGGRAGGTGTFDFVSISGGTFAPGSSPGRAETGDARLGAGSTYEVEINDAAGLAGAGFDLWSVNGTAYFDIRPGDAPFVLELVTLSPDDVPGILAHFDASKAWRWTVFEADAFQDFDDGDVVLDTSRFAAPGFGTFGLEYKLTDGRETLSIVYAPVPEPSTDLLVGGGLLMLAAMRRVRRPVQANVARAGVTPSQCVAGCSGLASCLSRTVCKSEHPPSPNLQALQRQKARPDPDSGGPSVQVDGISGAHRPRL